MPNWANADLTRDIIDAFCTVYRVLKNRRAYSAFNLAEALKIELQKHGHKVEREVTAQRTYRGESIGSDRVALVVDGLVAIIVKNVAEINAIHYAQLRSYLDDGHWPIGFLCNFGAHKPDFRRLDR